jgi:16S rRNA (cytosine967-C5)-methyltransferase
MVSPSRRAAVGALALVGSGRRTAAQALEGVRRTLPDPRDRMLVTEIVLGTLRWRAALDHVIERTSGRQIARIDATVLDVLRAAAFQLLHLERVPAHAVVDDAVDTVKQGPQARASGFVNAVLRRVAREGLSSLPGRPADLDADPDRYRAGARRRQLLDYLSVTLSHPRWLVSRWVDRLGPLETERWLRFNNTPATLTLRPNLRTMSLEQLRAALDDHGVATEPARYAPAALEVVRGRALDTDVWRDGGCWAQDEASQLVGWLPEARSGRRVLDLCAAPGGKTLMMLERMGDNGLLVAADYRPRRVTLLLRTLARVRARAVRVVRLDASGPLPLRPLFDVVLLDAPCSGLGTLRREPDLRWRRQPADLPALVELEGRILERASGAVAPGGQLVYATCSSEPDENQAVVDAFLRRHPEFALEPWSATSTGLAGNLFDAEGRLATSPGRHGLEAFFAAGLRRRAQSPAPLGA